MFDKDLLELQYSFIQDILDTGYDNILFAHTVYNLLDNTYLNDVVYNRLSSTTRKNLLQSVTQNKPIKTKFLNELYDILLSDLENIENILIQE